ncbi:hypothetical protein ACHAXA_009847 [Cyclostephanos tholiformis]|uniref:Uncharacterized protein n=1 Tax=Cyclostephanos tholiformis TaxID=382380 RepID=A0ABD3RDM0_9STRA
MSAMFVRRRRALLHISILSCCAHASDALACILRPSITVGLRGHPFLHPPTSNASRAAVRRHPFARGALEAMTDDGACASNDDPGEITSSDDDALVLALDSNDLGGILSYLRSHDPTSISSLSSSRVRSIFRAIEVTTSESITNTVNKRALEDAKFIEFRSPPDRVRGLMTALYRSLRDGGRLLVFGAVGRPPPPPMSSSVVDASYTMPPELPIYPTSGSRIISPKLLGEITNLDMISLTPRPTNALLYGGVALAALEGFASLYFGIDFNLLVAITILFAVLDQVLVSGAVFETALRMARPEMSGRIIRHEAGHFLCAYLLGCPVEGVVLSTWAALNDGRFGGRSARAVSAGTSYYDLDLSEQISGARPLTRESVDRYSIIVMGGIAAEAIEYGRADGGAGDEDALVRFLRSLNPRSRNAVTAWTPDLIRNQARWGATQAVLLLREYKPCYDALVDALERGGDLGQCIVAIEEAARREEKGRLQKPLGIVLGEGEFGKWVAIDEAGNQNDLKADWEMIGGAGTMLQPSGSSSISSDDTNGVPTYGDDPITSTEAFLQQYRKAMEKKLATIDEKLEELEAKERNTSPESKL